MRLVILTLCALVGFGCAQKKAPGSNWKFSQSKDEMRGTTTDSVTNISASDLNLAFPYKGAQAALIIESDHVFLNITKGRFKCDNNTVSYCLAHIKYDEGPVEDLMTGVLDLNKGNLLLIGEAAFIVKLKAAKKIMIEADFYDDGVRVIKFDVSGLVWPPAPATAK